MTNLPAPPGDYRSAIIRAASDPTIDVDKMQSLLDMQAADDIRRAEQAFIAAHSDAEAEMGQITADANNPQTRSRYATFARLDREVRPIYTRYGFNISFTTEPMGTPDHLLVVGTLAHRQGFSRRYQLPVPIVTVGIKGQAMMTPIHATMSAVSYGKRNLEIMMFNLQVGDDDDDGNRAGGARRPPAMSTLRSQPREIPDPDTGELAHVTHVEPCAITFLDNNMDDWRSWGEKLMWGLRKSTSIDEVDAWCLLNEAKLKLMELEKPALFKTLMSSVGNVKDGILQT